MYLSANKIKTRSIRYNSVYTFNLLKLSTKAAKGAIAFRLTPVNYVSGRQPLKENTRFPDGFRSFLLFPIITELMWSLPKCILTSHEVF